jgi:long-chain acyl-CoA synthetase
MMRFEPKRFDFQGINYNNQHITCEEFKLLIINVSVYIKKHNKNDSPFIYLIAENHPKTVIAYFAILHANFSCVIIDPDWKTLEWQYLMSDTPPSAIIKIAQDTPLQDFSKDIEFLVEDPSASFDEKRGYTIVYTAAEDGFAKGALLSQHNIMTNAMTHATTNKAGSSDTICALLPMSHLFGLTIGVIAPILSHSKVLIANIKNISRIDQLLDELYNNKVTYLYTIPVLLYLLGNTKDADIKLSSIKIITSGGYKLPDMIYSNYKRKFSIDIHEGYGLTEASPVCAWHHPDDDIKFDSVGTPFHCCDFKVIDENNDILALNTIGELCIRGENVMEGYYHKDHENHRVLTDNWLHTGDLGKIDNDGYIYITGVKKKMTHVGGRNVYPEELVHFLRMNNNLEDVRLTFSESALTGTKISAQIKLIINNETTQKEFMKWCIQNIAAYKLPKAWEFGEIK